MTIDQATLLFFVVVLVAWPLASYAKDFFEGKWRR